MEDFRYKVKNSPLHIKEMISLTLGSGVNIINNIITTIDDDDNKSVP